MPLALLPGVRSDSGSRALSLEASQWRSVSLTTVPLSSEPSLRLGAAPVLESGIPDMAELVEKVRQSDSAAMELLYGTLIRGVRHMLRRQLPEHAVDDRTHNVFVITVNAIREGQIREPERLPGFVRTVALRQAAEVVRRLEHKRKQVPIDVSPPLADESAGPEGRLLEQERWRHLAAALRALSDRDRELLTRYYLSGESQEVICQAMGLTSTQFRLNKSRAKARLGHIGRQSVGVVASHHAR